MKVARFVLKIVAAALTLAAVVCAVIAFWDKIADVVEAVQDKCCKTCRPAEYDDFADVD